MAFFCPALACYDTILFYTVLFYHWFYVVLQINKIKKNIYLFYVYGKTRMTSSTKPEIRSVSLRCQRRTEPRPLVTCRKTLVKIGRVVPKIWSPTNTHRETERQTYTLITILRFAIMWIGLSVTNSIYHCHHTWLIRFRSCCLKESLQHINWTDLWHDLQHFLLFVI